MGAAFLQGTFLALHLVILLLVCATSTLTAAPPVVSTLDIRALQIGKVSTLTFTGSDLLPNPRLLTTARLARQTVKEGAKPNQITLEVELAPDVQPGYENYWLVTDGGVSARGLLALDALEQKAFAEKVDSLPVALHGTLSGSQVREVSFTGKAGQEIICEVEAQRLESKLRPVLKLFGAGNALVQWSLPMAALRGDTRLQARLPADGTYRLQFHDLQYAATGPGQFRLKIGQWSYADLVFPPTVQRGGTAEVQLIGREGEANKVRLSPITPAPAVPAPWADPATASGPPAAVRLSDAPELVEERTGQAPQPLPALPVALNGRIGAPGEEDLYELTVEPETEIDLEITADVLGSPMDAELELRDAKGARVASNDDTPTSPDPRLSYKVPKDVTKLIAVVRNVTGQGGPSCIYRLRAALKAPEKSAGFNLVVLEDSHTLEPGHASVFKVEALRNGYEGPITLAFNRLPPGVTMTGGTVPAKATGALLTFSTTQPLPEVITALQGEGEGVEALARFDSAQLTQAQPWLVNDLALAGAAKSDLAFSANWGAGAEKGKVVLSNKLVLPVTCVRPPGHDGPVRLTLLTSQARKFNKDAIDATMILREEKATLIEEDKAAQAAYDAIAPAEVALTAAQKALEANKDEKVTEALAKKREAAQTALDAAKSKAAEAWQKMKNDVEYTVVIPADLPDVPHQFSIKAELLKRNRTTVEAVAYLPVRDLPVINPLVVQLDTPAPLKLDPKKPGVLELTGKIERLEGATGDVTVTLTEPPAGLAAPAAVTVKTGTSDFKFALNIPTAFKPGDYPGLKVTAAGKPFGTIQVKSREATIPLKLLPPASPADVPSAKP